tara:strand:- start:171 stop:287 length:117 start_codon:yes stop_codon:yes gene_type:complete
MLELYELVIITGFLIIAMIAVGLMYVKLEKGEQNDYKK